MIEFLVTLAIVAITLSLGVPSFISIALDNTLVTQTNNLVHDLHQARSEAIKRNQSVVLCRSADGEACLPSSRAATEWSMGWITYVNTDNDRNRDADEEIIHVNGALPDDLSLTFNQWWRVIFRPTGGSKNGRFSFCGPPGSEKAREIVLYLTGRVRLGEEDSTRHCAANA